MNALSIIEVELERRGGRRVMIVGVALCERDGLFCMRL